MKPTGYYSDEELSALGVKFGKHVLISNKISIYGHQLEVGDYVRIDDFCVLVGDIRLGSYVHVAAFSQLSGSAGIVIEDFCSLSTRTLLFSRSDDYSGASMTALFVDDKYKKVIQGEIVIKKHSIIGAGSMIMPRVILAEGTAVGAFSLINKSTEAWSIYAGIPAKKIQNRKTNILELEQAFLQDMNRAY